MLPFLPEEWLDSRHQPHTCIPQLLNTKAISTVPLEMSFVSCENSNHSSRKCGPELPSCAYFPTGRLKMGTCCAPAPLCPLLGRDLHRYITRCSKTPTYPSLPIRGARQSFCLVGPTVLRSRWVDMFHCFSIHRFGDVYYLGAYVFRRYYHFVI
jgi:hypothetical protein